MEWILAPLSEVYFFLACSFSFICFHAGIALTSNIKARVSKPPSHPSRPSPRCKFRLCLSNNFFFVESWSILSKLKEASAVDIAHDASPEISEIEWPTTPVYFLSFSNSIASGLLILGFYRKKNVKLEEGKISVAWSNQEPDKEGANNIVDAKNSRGVLLNSDSQNVFDALSVRLKKPVINDWLVYFRSIDDEEEDPVMQVMLRSIQDPELALIYKGLPDLGLVFVTDCYIFWKLILIVRIYQSVHQYSYITTVGMGVVTLKDIQNRVSEDDIS